MKRLTPILFVEAVEPCLPFWTERLGFRQTMEVPEGDRLGFVALERNGLEIMIQTRASLEEDIPALAEESEGSVTFLFVEVADVGTLDGLEATLEEAGDPFVIPRRTTFYGADEVVVRDPCGHTVILAAFPQGG